jgi:hydroxypyruvate isomerase
MAGPKASFTWWSFANRGAGDDELIRAAAQMGYDGVELADEALWPAIVDAGMAIATHPGHRSLTSGLNRIENHDRIEGELLANIELAQRWGKPVLICFSGNRDGVSEEAGIENTALGLSRVAGAADDAGVTLALELLNSKVDHPGYQCDHTDWGLEVIARVDSPAVRLLYDVYHMQVMEGDIIRSIDAHHDALAHYHVAGNPGRNDPDRTQELNYPPIYAAIATSGFDGYVGMEYLPKGDPLSSLQASLEAFRAATSA